MNTDITYCTRDCANTECERNKNNVEFDDGFLWWSNWKDCEDYKDEQKNSN